MKLNKILPLFAFVLAIGSAFASEMFAIVPAWTSIDDVDLQTQNCEQRGVCDTGTKDCTVSFAIGSVQYTNIPAYDGGQPNQSLCGSRLTMK